MKRSDAGARLFFSLATYTLDLVEQFREEVSQQA